MSSFLDYDGLGKYHSENKKYIDDKVPTKTSELTNDSGFVTENDLNSAISNHNTSTSSHNDIRTLISDLTTKLNNFLDVDDTTTDQLSEVITLINNNKGTLESLTTSKINTSDIVDNLTTANAKKVLSANVGVVIKGLIDTLQSELDSHGHKISNVDGLQATLDDKANKSHGTHVTYGTDIPKVAGIGDVGTAEGLARIDHVHPAQTNVENATKASQDESGNNIEASYASSIDLSTDNQLALKSKSGATLSTIDLGGLGLGGGSTYIYNQTTEPEVSTSGATVWLAY